MKDAKGKTKAKSVPEDHELGLVRLLFYPLAFVAYELCLRICIYREFVEGTAEAVLVALCVGGIVSMFTFCFPKAINRLLGYSVLLFCSLYFSAQLIYYTVFQRFMSFQVAAGVGTDVLEFQNQILNTMAARWYGLLLLSAPIAICLLLDLGRDFFAPLQKGALLGPVCVATVAYLFFFLLLQSGGKKDFSSWDLYFNSWEKENGTQRLGMFVALRKDLQAMGPGGETDTLDILGGTGEATKPGKELPDAANRYPTITPEPSTENQPNGEAGPTVTPTPTPVYHELYDFAALAETESNKKIKAIHSYLAGFLPEKENQYTGMFEGYNLIMITAEGFSPWAIDKELTPTLYKLTHSGFVFENFYTPLWHTSTSDGEFIACTGLVPDGAHSMRRTENNDMRFAFGNQFSKLGYVTNAYHNNSYTYYERNKTHPNLGYHYTAIGNGLKLASSCWPNSDYEMFCATVPEYINNEPFHTYYMTVSGHMEYTFSDNSMARRNKEVVAGLPYSDNARAYIACNYELEKALTYLLEELEKAGVADHTVIALYPDHYPYGLDKSCIDELAGHEVEEHFEIYRSCFVLYCPGMKESVKVSKYCSTLDIAPTLSNLFGLSYDSRVFAGNDIFSDKEGFVILYNKSFITDRIKYDTLTGTVTLLTSQPVSQEYIDQKILEVKQKFAFTQGVIDNDYYSYLP